MHGFPEIFAKGEENPKSSKEAFPLTNPDANRIAKLLFSRQIFCLNPPSAKDERKTLNPPSFFSTTKKYWISSSAVLKPQDIPSFFRVYELRSMQMDGWLMGRGAQKDIWQTQDNVNELLFSSLTQKSRTKLLFWHFSTKHSCLS